MPEEKKKHDPLAILREVAKDQPPAKRAELEKIVEETEKKMKEGRFGL